MAERSKLERVLLDSPSRVQVPKFVCTVGISDGKAKKLSFFIVSAERAFTIFVLD
jgi:hypothetical protein